MKRVLSLSLPALLAACATTTNCSDVYDACTEAKAAECLRKASNGTAQDKFLYAQLRWSGHGCKTDQKEALVWYRAAAIEGHRISQTALGTFLGHNLVQVALRPPRKLTRGM
jgi:TPR repeat protein